MRSFISTAKPKNVLEVPTTCNGMNEKTKRPTQKPEELVRKIILVSSNEGDLVIDPFSGSGTTAVVASQLKDLLDKSYLEESRFNDTKKIIYSQLLKEQIEPWSKFYSDLRLDTTGSSGITKDYVDSLAYEEYCRFIKDLELFNYERFSKYLA